MTEANESVELSGLRGIGKCDGDLFVLMVDGKEAKQIGARLGCDNFDDLMDPEIEGRMHEIRRQLVECLRRYEVLARYMYFFTDSDPADLEIQCCGEWLGKLLTDCREFVTAIETLRLEHDRCQKELAQRNPFETTGGAK